MNRALIKSGVILMTTFLLFLTAYSIADETVENRAESVSEDFCTDALIEGTGLKLSVKNELHDGDMESFIDSKPGLEPLVIHQFEDNLLPDGSNADFSTTVSCKYKSPELIAELVSQKLETELSCQSINKRTIERLYESLPEPQSLLAKKALIFDEDDIVYIGPSWIRPWPYQVAYTKEGNLHIRSKTLYASNAWWIPMPKRFKGTHYCHLISPEYAQKLITQSVTAPSLSDD